MTTTALVKEGCGTHFVYDQGEVDRHLKLGWSIRPADWKAKKLAEDKERRLAANKAEMARLAAEAEALEAAPTVTAVVSDPGVTTVTVPKKPGRPKKA